MSVHINVKFAILAIMVALLIIELWSAVYGSLALTMILACVMVALCVLNFFLKAKP